MAQWIGGFTDPNLTQAQKNKMLAQVAVSVAKELHIKLGDVAVIATDAKTADGRGIKGAYHAASRDIAINDRNTANTGDAVRS